MAKNKKTTIPAGMPSEIAEKQGFSTNDITEGKDTGSWFTQPDVDKKIDEYVKKEGNNEPLSGSQGLVAKGNQGDNDLAYNNYEEKFFPNNGGEQLVTMLGGDQGETESIAPKPEDTADVTERHNEELAQLQNAIGDTGVVTGSIPSTENITEEVTPEVETETSNPISIENEMPKAPESANVDFSDYIKNYYGPKNGADYLKSLWSQGADGKAAAIGNVLGNILGATGKGLAGKDYTSDWQTYKDNYTKEMAERNQKAFDQNMEISKQLRTNDVARNEMLKTLENYEKIGKNLDPEKFESIRKALTATGKGSQIDYYLASALGELSSDPAFMEAAKEAGGNVVELLGNLAQFSGNTIRPLNWFFGQAGNTMNNMFGGR